jgi:uncharacterized protein DUF6233
MPQGQPEEWRPDPTHRGDCPSAQGHLVSRGEAREALKDPVVKRCFACRPTSFSLGE